MSYNTKQKEIILNEIKNQKKDFTIKEIYEKLKDSAGLTTIYRLIDKLIEEKHLSKINGKNNITYYRYLGDCEEENHIYLKCESCGEITHIDCDFISKLTGHILTEHKFKTSKDHLIITGICSNCIRKEG